MSDKFFHYTQEELINFNEIALNYANKIGVKCQVRTEQSNNLEISVNKQALHKMYHSDSSHLSLTLYSDGKKASANTSLLTKSNIEKTVQHAFNIMQYTESDESNSLPQTFSKHKNNDDLKLFSPSTVDIKHIIETLKETEEQLYKSSPLIKINEENSFNSQLNSFMLSNSNGFCGGYQESYYNTSLVAVAQKENQMVRDYWYKTSRTIKDVIDANHGGVFSQDLVNKTSQRTLARLDAKYIHNMKTPVLLDSTIASSLLSTFAQGINGHNIYKKQSFLLDQLHNKIFPEHISITDDPFLIGGFGSGYFDYEGVTTQKRNLIDNGVLNGYLLSTYSGKKLNMESTGNAGGSHNLILSSSKTKTTDNLEEMLNKLNTGIYVTELIGNATNLTTGDYSRGAFGFWVENGQIQYPITEFTIAGNLKDMFQNIIAVGSDKHTSHNKICGSVLIDNMSIAGN